MTTTIYITIRYKYNSEYSKLVGVYSTKELADEAGREAVEMWAPTTGSFTVTLKALDDIIDGT
jgi:hypothetical protein|tara:strand:+ start:14610 stop:14798 length:189 start_codon:yes stop_codon:yes gene_type:complete